MARMDPDTARRVAAQDARAWGDLGLAWSDKSAAAPQVAQAVAGLADRQPTPTPTERSESMEPRSEPMPQPAPRAPKDKPAAQVEPKPPARTQRPKPGSPREAAEMALADILADYTAAAPHEATGTPHSTIVFGEGDPCARIMFIGEAPGADEDRLGRPFVGRAGQKLDQMIQAMGLQREQVYIANVLKVRPPNNATPTIEEAQACAPFLMRQIEAIAPEAIVALGLPSARLLTGQGLSMRELRGQWWPMTTPSGQEFQVLPTYHPAYLLRNYTPDTRRKVWEDLKRVLERLGLPVSDR
ncbi:MAG: uracil-DNA glycosylase family protein [Phycisphaerales bacterium]